MSSAQSPTIGIMMYEGVGRILSGLAIIALWKGHTRPNVNVGLLMREGTSPSPELKEGQSVC